MMATAAQINTWLGILPTNMQITLINKLGFFSGKERAAYVVRNFIAQQYGLENAEAIYKNPWEWEGGRLLHEFQIRVLQPYTVPQAYRLINDPAGKAMEELLVRKGVLKSGNTLADTSHVVPETRSLDAVTEFFTVGGTSAIDEVGEFESADSDINEYSKLENAKKPRPDFAQSWQGYNSDRLIAGYDGSQSLLSGLEGSVEIAMLNQQSSLVIQSLAMVNNFNSFDTVGVANYDEQQSHIIAAPSTIL